MNDRMGRPSRHHQSHGHQPQDLQSQVGFYLLPPDHQGGTKSKKKSRSKGHHGSRRWASQNHLDAITEASDESRPNSPGGVGDPHHHQRGQGPAWNSSPGRLVRDHTSMSQRGLFGDVQVPSVDMAATSKLLNCRHPQGRICENLRHGLQQLKYRGQRDAYKVSLKSFRRSLRTAFPFPFQAIVDAIVVGPEAVRTAEAEDILGLNPDSILRARARNRDVAAMHNLDDNDTGTSGFEFDNPYDQDSKRNNKYSNNRRLFMSMRDLFVHFSRYGDPHASGQHITLSQSDKWMKQAGVIDNWNVTSTDTAIAFRKISRYTYLYTIFEKSNFCPKIQF